MLIFLFLPVLISWLVYRKAFHSPDRTQNNDHAVIMSEQMEPFSDWIHELIDTFQARPFEPVSIRSHDGLKLAGRYYHRKDGAPLIICFHGYRGTPIRDFAGGSLINLNAGYNVLMIYERAHGESEGHAITFGIEERKDVLSWIEYAVDRFGPDVKILLNGISMGAATVLMASGLPLPSNVKGIVADCPYTSPRAIIRKVCREDLGIPALPAWPFLLLGARLFGHFRLNTAADASRAVKRSPVPILLIHGDDDRFVPLSMSLEIARSNPGKIDLQIFHGAGHGISYLTDPVRYEETVLKFYRKCLNA